MLIVNTPLTDETGVEFAIRIALRTEIPVLLLVDTAAYEEILYQTRGSGIFVLRRPVTAEIIVQAAQLLVIASEKASRYAAEAARLRRRLEDLNVVSRAKLLLIEKERMKRAREVAGCKPLLRLLPLKSKKVGVVTTGSEVFCGRIQDTFTPVIEAKLKEFGGSVMTEHVTLGDDHQAITAAILDMLSKGCEMVLCSGGMSVDPDDKTPLAIKNTGANIVSYGSPVLPGAMFLVSYMPDGRPVCGLPGCVMYAKRTIFDLLLPYLVTDTPITKEQLAGLGHGGLCLNCPVCHFPNCGFGKGV